MSNRRRRDPGMGGDPMFWLFLAIALYFVMFGLGMYE